MPCLPGGPGGPRRREDRFSQSSSNEIITDLQGLEYPMSLDFLHLQNEIFHDVERRSPSWCSPTWTIDVQFALVRGGSRRGNRSIRRLRRIRVGISIRIAFVKVR